MFNNFELLIICNFFLKIRFLDLDFFRNRITRSFCHFFLSDFEYLNLSVGIFRLVESGWSFLLIENRKRRPSPFCCASLGLGKVYEEKAYFTLFAMKLVFQQIFVCPQIHQISPLDLSKLLFGVFHWARVMILTS